MGNYFTNAITLYCEFVLFNILTIVGGLRGPSPINETFITIAAIFLKNDANTQSKKGNRR